MSKVTATDLNWLAGVFDSRGGCAAVPAHGYFRMKVYVDCVRTAVLDQVLQVVGCGVIYISPTCSPAAPFASRQGIRHRWTVTTKNARDFLNAIRPHVRLATTQARIDEVLAKDATRVPGFTRKSRAKVKP